MKKSRWFSVFERYLGYVGDRVIGFGGDPTQVPASPFGDTETKPSQPEPCWPEDRMHCTGMTDEEALVLLVERAYQSEGEAILKIIRAKQSSCQLSTYFVGRMAFQRLRRRFQNELGDDFSLSRYHEAVLAHGTLPVRYLPELVGDVLKKRQP